MKLFFKQTYTFLLVLLTIIFITGCGGPKDVAAMKGEDWVQLDKATQEDIAQELLKNADETAKDHTPRYFAKELNIYFSTPGKSDRLVKDAFQELASSGKTADELAIVDGNAWKTMTQDAKRAMLEAEVKDIADKNPAFKPKAIDEYLKEMDKIFKTDDSKFLKLPVKETIQKLLTNNLIIHGERLK